MLLEYLAKKGGSRLHDVATYRGTCEGKDLTGFTTLKPWEEVADDRVFTHVFLANLGKNAKLDTSFVIKAYEHGTVFAKRELKVWKRLQNTAFKRHIPRYICDFSCLDDKSRWFKNINKKTPVCLTDGIDTLHFFVMEYVRNGDVNDFIKSTTHLQHRSLLLQVLLMIADLAYNYRIYHGDLNSGNILVRTTSKKTVKYRIKNKVFTVKTHGFVPMLVDFALSHVMPITATVRSSLVTDDIMTACHVLSNSMENTLKQNVKQFTLDEGNTTDLAGLFQKLKEITKYVV